MKTDEKKSVKYSQLVLFYQYINCFEDVRWFMWEKIIIKLLFTSAEFKVFIKFLQFLFSKLMRKLKKIWVKDRIF
mgnify:CR=1 FL=1